MRHYSDIIIAPVITEKSMAERQNGVYTFKVAKDAQKLEIKKAIEEAFKDLHDLQKEGKVISYDIISKDFNIDKAINNLFE